MAPSPSREGWLLRRCSLLQLSLAALSPSPPLALAIPPLNSAPPLLANRAPPATESSQPSERVVYMPPAVEAPSSREAVGLAKHLKARKARMYGAYWCSHCFGQKAAFGKQGAALIDYVECAEDGYNSRRSLCRDKAIRGYPTWEIEGEFYTGEKSLSDLAEISGFRM